MEHMKAGVRFYEMPIVVAASAEFEFDHADFIKVTQAAGQAWLDHLQKLEKQLS